MNATRKVKPPKKKRTRTVSEPISLTPTTTQMKDLSPPERRNFIFYQDFGGFQATDIEDSITPVVYYVGIIDIFTEYTFKKKTETAFKSITQKMKDISSINSKKYGVR